MALFSLENPWLFTFGVLGNIVSFMVYLVPLSTFYRIIKKKSTEGFQSIPYVVALFSSMIWLYYASLKSNVTLLITINSVGCVMETIYIAIYIAYSPRKAKILTVKLVTTLNLVGFWLIIILTHYLVKGADQVQVLGWICLVLSVSSFAAPLSIVAKVIRTRSVEFMPFWLSFFLALSAVMWFFYGILQKDFYIALPNVLGFIFGIVQMVLYAIYKNCKVPIKDEKLPSDVLKEISVMTDPIPPPEEKTVCSQGKLGDDENREKTEEKMEEDQTQQQQQQHSHKITDASNQV